jgi:hypothetical protein
VSSVNNARVWDAICTLRTEGCAVAILEPEELDGADPQCVEEAMVNGGQEAVIYLVNHSEE